MTDKNTAPQDGWISIKNDLPRPYTFVDVWVAKPYNRRIADVLWTGEMWLDDQGDSDLPSRILKKLTHWRRLPQSPLMG